MKYEHHGPADVIKAYKDIPYWQISLAVWSVDVCMQGDGCKNACVSYQISSVAVVDLSLIFWPDDFNKYDRRYFMTTPRHFVLNYWWQRCRWGGGLGALTIILWSFIFLCLEYESNKLRRKSWDAILLRGFFKMAAKVKSWKVNDRLPKPTAYSVFVALCSLKLSDCIRNRQLIEQAGHCISYISHKLIFPMIKCPPFRRLHFLAHFL